MGIEKRGSNYGGLLQVKVLDRKVKSQKKVLSSNPDLSDNSNSKKKNKREFNATLPTAHLPMMDEDGIGSVANVREKGPGVVARLMGLNSMPKLFDSYQKTKNLECNRHEEVVSQLQAEHQNPVPHHKLVSPIKRTHFVCGNKIMEAAASVLPQESRKMKAPFGGKSLRVSEKKRNGACKSRNGGSSPMRILQDSEQVKSKRSSVSLALRANANVRKQEGLSSRKFVSDAEKTSSSPNMLFTSQKSSSNVLRQNNRVVEKIAAHSKSSSRKLKTKDDKRHVSPSSSETTREKRSVDGIRLSEMEKHGKVSISESERMGGTDVISFTFSAPMRSTSKRMTLNSNFNFLGHDVKGDDTLSRYLEQQIEELAHKVDLISQPKSKDFDDQPKLQGMYGRNISEDQTCLSFRFQSPVSVLERSSLTEASNSSDSTRRSHSSGASSTCAAKRGSWELDYVKRILRCDVEQMLNEYAMGRSCDIISPHLFEQLERSNHCFNVSRMSRRLVFDCTSEFMETRFTKHGIGGPTGVWMVKHKGRMAQEVCKEISGWSSIKDFEVDELIDRDMTRDQWLGYDAEKFEMGTKIEGQVLNSLIDEVVADMLMNKFKK